MSLSSTSDIRGPWDAVVVGHGFAGLTAAKAHLEAARAEGRTARVAVLERAPYEQRGGSTRWTTAVLSLTAEQELIPFWGERVRETAGELANEAYIEAFYRLVPETLEWLRESGISFDEYHGMWSVHGGGASVVDAFPDQIRALGGEIFYDTTALGLVRGDGGQIAGIDVRDTSGATVRVETRAVILASGGFEGDHEWLTRYIPEAYKLRTVSPGTRNNRGDGIRIAVEVGADTAGQFDGAHVEPCDPRSDDIEPLVPAYWWGILVNRQGERFMDEAAELQMIHFDTVGNTILRTQGNLAYAIVSDPQSRLIARIPGVRQTDIDPIVADSIEELAEKLAIDPGRLRRTVDEFNAATPDPAGFDPTALLDGLGTTGIAPPKSNFATALTDGPFRAWPVSGQICFTYGGLRVDGDTHVLDVFGRPIPGLYAAGEIAGVFYEQYPAGTSGLRSMTFGRWAGLTSSRESVPEPVGSEA
ncbi:FAD-binding protein [Microbacterium sp. JZ70]